MVNTLKRFSVVYFISKHLQHMTQLGGLSSVDSRGINQLNLISNPYSCQEHLLVVFVGEKLASVICLE
jgi:hypothetical protein